MLIIHFQSQYYTVGPPSGKYAVTKIVPEYDFRENTLLFSDTDKYSGNGFDVNSFNNARSAVFFVRTRFASWRYRFAVATHVHCGCRDATKRWNVKPFSSVSVTVSFVIRSTRRPKGGYVCNMIHPRVAWWGCSIDVNGHLFFLTETSHLQIAFWHLLVHSGINPS